VIAKKKLSLSITGFVSSLMATHAHELKADTLPGGMPVIDGEQLSLRGEDVSVQIKMRPNTKYMGSSVATNPEIVLPSGEPLTLSSNDLMRVKTVTDFMRMSNKNEATVRLYEDWASVDGNVVPLDIQDSRRFCLPGATDETSGSETSEDSESTETSENTESSEDSEDSENTESSESSETKEGGMMTPDLPLPKPLPLPLPGAGCGSSGFKPGLPSRPPLVIELSGL
jgi:hypothetical protein